MSDEQSRFQEIHFLFPEGKDKALTFSYDDAQVYDRRLVSIFDRYDMKATFHLNSSTLDREGFVTRSEINQLYVNHEIACHGVTHPFFNQLSQAQTRLTSLSTFSIQAYTSSSSYLRLAAWRA